MKIKKITITIIQFCLNRVIEILGVSISLAGLLLLVALISYSPEDPNFIFPENMEIKNFFRFQGSFISDLFFSINRDSFIFDFCNIFFHRNYCFQK